MARILPLLIIAWLTACAQEKGPTQTVSAPQATPVKAETETTDFNLKLKTYFCATMADCVVKEKSNADFDYGPWFSNILDMNSLKSLETSQTSYVAIGPDAEGYNTNIGVIKYQVPPNEKSSILKQLTDVPNGMFNDDKVLMQFKATTDDEHIIVIFTDSHGPEITNFFQTL